MKRFIEGEDRQGPDRPGAPIRWRQPAAYDESPTSSLSAECPLSAVEPSDHAGPNSKIAKKLNQCGVDQIRCLLL